MRYLNEYRDPDLARCLLDRIHALATHPWTLMEVCGGQTHTLLRSGIDRLLPESVRLVHGPGCPVCVTGLETIDRALAVAALPQVTFCSFGDMLRVPGSHRDLLQARAEGGDVRIVYSPLDAVRLAKKNPDRQVVFFAVGFETTTPATALAVLQARELGLKNFTVLAAHVLVPPAMRAVLEHPDQRVQGFLAAGHVCTVVGWEPYLELSEKYRVPIVVAGFEPLDLLEAIHMVVAQLEEGRAEVENQYSRAVTRPGNRHAQEVVRQVYEVCDRAWRGLGILPQSGLRLRREFADFDAEVRFPITGLQVIEPAECRSGAVLQGLLRPDQCEAFGTRCTPDRPLGAPMVSDEGACAAYWKYGRAPAVTADPLERRAY